MLPFLLVEPSLPLCLPPIGKSLLSGRKKKLTLILNFVLQELQKITQWLAFSVESADVPKVADYFHSTLQPLKDFTRKSAEVNF